MVKKISSIVVILLSIVLIASTIYKINKQHENKLYYVLNSRIEYASNRCYLEKKCDSTFTLKDLYDNKYLETEYDPITKEELDSSLEIKIRKNKVVFDKINK